MDHYLPSVLSDGLYHADGQQRDEVFVWGSFLQSRMHRAGVTCADCHDPHTQKLRAQGNAVCAQCHLASKYDSKAHHFHPAGTNGAQCANCHMPATTYMVVIRGAITACVFRAPTCRCSSARRTPATNATGRAQRNGPRNG
jgi:predicted CXXCH cytochrome family protein